MEFKCICSLKIFKKKIQVATPFKLVSSLLRTPPGPAVDRRCLKLSFSSRAPDSGAPGGPSPPLPSASCASAVRSGLHYGAGRRFPLADSGLAARAEAPETTWAPRPGCPPPLRFRGTPGAPGPWLCSSAVEVTGIQCGLPADFWRKVTGVVGMDFTVDVQ